MEHNNPPNKPDKIMYKNLIYEESDIPNNVEKMK